MTNSRRILTYYHSLQIGMVEAIIVSAIAEMGGRATPSTIGLITGHKVRLISSTCRKLAEKGLVKPGGISVRRHRQTILGPRLVRGGGREWELDTKIYSRLTKLESRAPLPGSIATNIAKKIEGKTVRKRSASPPAGKKTP